MGFFLSKCIAFSKCIRPAVAVHIGMLACVDIVVLCCELGRKLHIVLKMR